MSEHTKKERFELASLEKELTTLLADFEEERRKREKVQRENQLLQEKLEVVEAQNRTLMERQKEEQPVSKEMLADVLLEAKRTADQMVRKAEYEAYQILTSKQGELNEIHQSAREYGDTIRMLQHTSERILTKWAEQVEKILQETDAQ